MTDRQRGVTRRAAAGARLTRTILLGALAVVFSIVWLARELGLERADLLGYLWASILLVGGLTLAGSVAGGLFWLLRRLTRRRD